MSLPKNYKQWVIDIIDWEYIDISKFDELISILADVEYYYVNPMDENRLEDGENLRWEYEYYGHILPTFDCPVSVLEVLAAICERVGCFRDPEYIGNPAGFLFWQIMDNLNLLQYTDGNIVYDEIYDILNRWMSGDYTGDSGGIFIVPGCDNLANEEMWHQLDLYLENLPDTNYI